MQGADSYMVLHMRPRVFLMDQPLIGLMAWHRLWSEWVGSGLAGPWQGDPHFPPGIVLQCWSRYNLQWILIPTKQCNVPWETSTGYKNKDTTTHKWMEQSWAQRGLLWTCSSIDVCQTNMRHAWRKFTSCNQPEKEDSCTWTQQWFELRVSTLTSQFILWKPWISVTGFRGIHPMDVRTSRADYLLAYYTGLLSKWPWR